MSDASSAGIRCPTARGKFIAIPMIKRKIDDTEVALDHASFSILRECHSESRPRRSGQPSVDRSQIFLKQFAIVGFQNESVMLVVIEVGYRGFELKPDVR